MICFPTRLGLLYKDTVSNVRVNGDLSEWFITISGARLCAIATDIDILLEVVMALALENNEFGAKVSGFCISNLRFADDICLIAEGNDDLQQTVDKLYTTGQQRSTEQRPKCNALDERNSNEDFAMGVLN